MLEFWKDFMENEDGVGVVDAVPLDLDPLRLDVVIDGNVAGGAAG